MIPKVVQELICSFNHAESINRDEVGRTVAHDQVLTARVLRLANAPRFGRSRRVCSLSDALVILGFNHLRILVIASGVTGATANIPNFDLRSFWQHCFEIANTSQTLAQLSRQDPQLAYTCGLIARIGELVLHVAVPDITPKIDREVAAGKDRMEVERTSLGVDSAQIGAELARRWGFPDIIIQAIDKQRPQNPSNAIPPLAALLGLARQIVHGFNHQQNEASVLADITDETLSLLGLTRERITAAMSDLKEVSTTIDDFL